jgi:hypothetical protein
MADHVNKYRLNIALSYHLNYVDANEENKSGKVIFTKAEKY